MPRSADGAWGHLAVVDVIRAVADERATPARSPWAWLPTAADELGVAAVPIPGTRRAPAVEENFNSLDVAPPTAACGARRGGCRGCRDIVRRQSWASAGRDSGQSGGGWAICSGRARRRIAAACDDAFDLAGPLEHPRTAMIANVFADADRLVDAVPLIGVQARPLLCTFVEVEQQRGGVLFVAVDDFLLDRRPDEVGDPVLEALVIRPELVEFAALPRVRCAGSREVDRDIASCMVSNRSSRYSLTAGEPDPAPPPQ